MNSCKICEQPGAGNHFGVNSCRACAAFFRRGALRKEPYTCKSPAENEKCEIYNDVTQQYNCKKCRMNKCQKMGMKVEKFQHGRDWIKTSKLSKKSKNVSRPKFLFLEDRKRMKKFVELKFLLQEAENILLNGTSSPLHVTSSTLLNLSNAHNLVRDLPNTQTFHRLKKWGAAEKLKDWETSFFTVANIFTHFEQFQKLPISIRMKIFTGVWHLWVLFDKLAMNFVARKSGFAKTDNIVIAGYNTYFDLLELDLNLDEFSKYKEENAGRFILSIDWNMVSFIKPLMDLDPDKVELTFMICQFCFNYAGKRFQGSILEISEKFQDVLANDLHNYYVNDLKILRYSTRLGQLMKFVRSLEAKL